MSDEKKAQEEVYGISSATEHHTQVTTGHGDTKQRHGAKTKEVLNADLFTALEETKIERWSKESIHLYFCIFVAFCCACANGYDGSLMGSILAMDHYQAIFKTGMDGSKVSVVTSLYTVGSMVCTPISAIISDRLGRRKCMFIGAWVIIIGSVIITSAMTLAQFVVGRFVLGLGIQVMVVSAPAYAVEISPPHWRGRAGGLYNCGWFGGSIPAAALTYGTEMIDNNWQWRIPFICQCFACIIVICSVWFIPESPRWLIANGRNEEAEAFLVKYHGNGNPNARLVRLEIEEMREGIRIDGIDKRWWDYRPFVTTKSGRWRFAQVIMISVFGQWSGNGLGYFNATIFKVIGYESSSTQLLLNLVNSIVSAVGALTAVYFCDRMRRRPVLIFGTLACAITLAINAGILQEVANTGSIGKNKGQAALAFYYLFNVVFSFTYTPLQGVIPAEALETTTRSKGLALSGFMVSSISFISQFATPIGLANISTNYFWIFVGWDFVESAFWYFFCVESQGRTLEQLEWVYQQPNPVKASLNVHKVLVQEDGTVTEKITDDDA
ncbi:Major facilitator superfamily domain general substrate transporter [Penicillium robsamsonii]|uniref:Major facilitator superfamily domain general substrate transporter n=1 Tax=Penicillium robsamsonii TaxID=1792511 RepID=UPI002547F8F2|nr:Major facilitator superfamily domain general substrate transporter [Penicillium robsamsonii]KAJ5827180.1 Major facilitator superfamily domain general substrate transporter [Penicillium robsamsonii]